MLLEPEIEPPLKIPIGLKEERYNEGYTPAIIPTRKVNMKRLEIRPGEKLNESSLEETVLNHGRMNQTTKSAKTVAAKVWKTDSVINWRKMLNLLPPFTFFIPISTERSDARATDNAEKFNDAISTIRNASPENIHTYL